MRLEVLRNELEKFLNTTYKLDPRFEATDESISAKCNIKFKHFDDDVLLQIVGFKSGAASISFLFDKIELTSEIMLRLNAFNEHVHWIKAYINENGYLAFQHQIIDAVIESNVIDATEFLFNVISDEQTRKHLDTLTALTYGENNQETEQGINEGN